MIQWSVCRANGGSVLPTVIARRFARSRGTQKQHARAAGNEPAGVASFSPPSVPPLLRPTRGGVASSQLGGFVTADTPSISSLRADIDLMRKERVFEEHIRQTLKKRADDASRQASIANSERSQSHGVLRGPSSAAIGPAAPPPYNITDGAVGDAIKASDWLLNRRIQRDVADVLRRRKSANSSDGSSMKLAQMAGVLRAAPSAIGDNSAAVKDLARRVERALKQYAPDSQLNDVSSGDPVYLAAVLDVVHEATDSELRLWLRLGLIDPLWWDDATVEEVGETGDVDNDDDPLHVTLSAGRCCSYINAAMQRLAHADMPPPDVSPAVLKAERGDFGDISEKELRALEDFEKQNGQALGRSFAPSSPLLAQLSKTDAKIQASLDVLERVKRDTLLDSEFQSAVAYVNALHEGRLNSLERVKPKPRTKAAEVPYFFGSNRSRPPPEADMNLPQPSMSREERISLRRRRSLKVLRQRYTK